MSDTNNRLHANEALKRLIAGNAKYMIAKTNGGDISAELRNELTEHGQHPYAVIITCSDSRVVPEHIFMTGLGELFVIRVAGNVIGDIELGSIEYAVEHLGASLVVLMGHTHCGAVNATINGGAEGYTKAITDKIKLAIKNEKDDRTACAFNVIEGCKTISESLKNLNFKCLGAIYDIESGKVEIISVDKK